MLEKENTSQDENAMKFYSLFDGLSDKYSNKEFKMSKGDKPDNDIENRVKDTEESLTKESNEEKVNEIREDKQEENKKKNKDILEDTSLKEFLSMSKTQRKNFARKLLNQDSKRLFQEINNITSELEGDTTYPYNVFIPQDSLDIQVEIKRLTNKMWRQLKNLPKSERNTLVPTVENNLLQLDSFVNRGRFNKSIRKKSYTEAQSVLFEIRSSIELMRDMKYISHDRYINYDMSVTKINKQLTQLIKSTIKSSSSN